MAIREDKLGGTDWQDGNILTADDLNDTFDALSKRNIVHGGNTAEMAYKAVQTTGFENGGNIMAEKFTDSNGLKNTVNGFSTKFSVDKHILSQKVKSTESSSNTTRNTENLNSYNVQWLKGEGFFSRFNLGNSSTRQGGDLSISVRVGSEILVTKTAPAISNGNRIIDIDLTEYSRTIKEGETVTIVRSGGYSPSTRSSYSYTGTAFSISNQSVNCFHSGSAPPLVASLIGYSETGAIVQNRNTLSVTGSKREVQPKITGYHLDTANYANKNVSIASGDYPESGVFYNGGSKLLVLNHNSYTLFRYTLSSPYDLDTASKDNWSKEIPQANQPFGLNISPDGTKLFVIADVNNSVYQYTVTTAFDWDTIVDTPANVFSTPEGSPTSLRFGKNGTRMYIAGTNNDRVYQYNLTTPYETTSAGQPVKSFSVASQDTEITDMEFSEDGTKFFMLGAFSDKVYEYIVRTPWESDTIEYTGVNFSTTTQDLSPRGIMFRPNGNSMYIIGDATDRIYQYTLTSKHTVIEVNQTKTNGFTYHYEGDIPYGTHVYVRLKGFGTKSLSKTGVAFSDSQQTFSEPSGVKINFLFNKHITTISKAVGCTATKCYVRFNNGTIVAQADFVGNFATFNRDFSAGSYIIDVDNSGSNYVSQRQVNPGFPIQTTNVHYNTGSFNQNDFNTLYNILSINTGEIIETEEVEVDNVTKKVNLPIEEMDNEPNIEIQTKLSTDDTSVSPTMKGNALVRY